ncbi:MAG: 16S rRNA (guanine(966)-N(2))-methyltransferase RsmD [Thomasclavelia sp.]|uniref:16S rRNA (guanine(966)-N(2))-methyltransferase RsmD n=1 Tax=Thomasclavelia sp. TaxID=3025757 RepID=UPI00399FD994
MRVIAGKYKSRQLKSVKSNLTRPTTDRNKENMFNIIGPYFQGGNVLDLFAGSGGLGIEALSRGCDYLYSVDNQFAAFQVIKDNLALLKIDNAKVLKLDYRKALKRLCEEKIKFDLVLLDPPYGKGLIDEILEFLISNEMLNKNCIIMVEELKEVVFNSFDQLILIKKNDYGITALNVFKYQG